MSLRTVIAGVGSYLPARLVSNAELAKTVDTTDEWIVTRSGIRQRYIVAEGEKTLHMAAKAAERAIAHAGIAKETIDLVLVATTTPDQPFPSVAAQLQAEIGLKPGMASDVQAVCAGFVYALAMADSLIKNGLATTALVIGADSITRLVDWQDRATCVLFGDGAGAVVLKAEQGGSRGILSAHLSADGRTGPLLYAEKFIQMQGKEVFKNAVQQMSASTVEALARANIKPEQVDWVVPHQANQRILDATIERLGLPPEKLISTVAQHANTSAASIPLALDVAFRDGRIQPGQLLALTAIGGGLAWGSVILRV